MMPWIIALELTLGWNAARQAAIAEFILSASVTNSVPTDRVLPGSLSIETPLISSQAKSVSASKTRAHKRLALCLNTVKASPVAAVIKGVAGLIMPAFSRAICSRVLPKMPWCSKATVVMQVAMNGNAGTTMPKLIAILLPFALGVGGSVYAIVTKGGDKARNKGLLIGGIGVAAFVLTLLMNL